MTNVSMIWDAVSVKQAAFVQVSHDGPDANYPNPTEFFLQHYDTTILRGYWTSDNEPQIMNMLLEGRTKLDEKAINQVLKYLHVDKSLKELAREIKEIGLKA